ncbi:hypothetical protein [Arthrobacter sp. M4]|uniref:hypothetical protein n=1 Tax=Arthrobacter sp. M4 TaxID=218160 RepID=UPI001CDB8B5E|nr:hypothetical protein [Arthrobacter sp. M4]MCA4132472.1 hypothetical protein [Arthrobacter sp. M4]
MSGVGPVFTNLAGELGAAFGAFLGEAELGFGPAGFLQVVHDVFGGVWFSLTVATTSAASAMSGVSFLAERSVSTDIGGTAVCILDHGETMPCFPRADIPDAVKAAAADWCGRSVDDFTVDVRL